MTTEDNESGDSLWLSAGERQRARVFRAEAAA
jgi:hypothetical protein